MELEKLEKDSITILKKISEKHFLGDITLGDITGINERENYIESLKQQLINNQNRQRKIKEHFLQIDQDLFNVELDRFLQI